MHNNIECEVKFMLFFYLISPVFILIVLQYICTNINHDSRNRALRALGLFAAFSNFSALIVNNACIS